MDSERTTHIRQYVHSLYIVWSLLLLLMATVALFYVARQVGAPYGGFIYIHDPSLRSPFYVGAMPGRTSFVDLDQLRFLDTLIAIDGRPSEDYPTIYAHKRPGDAVTYTIERNGARRTLVEPARQFTWDVFLTVHGLLYLVGLSTLLAGYALIRAAHQPYMQTFAFLMPIAAGGAFFHIWAYGGIRQPATAYSWGFLLLGAPAFGLGGAIILHTALLYPRPSPLLQRHPRRSMLLYLPPLVLNLAYALSGHPATRRINLGLAYANFASIVLYLALAALAGMAAYTRLRQAGDQAALHAMRSLAGVWGVLTGSIVIFWILPMLVVQQPLLPFEVLLAFAAMMPLGLVYGLLNSESVRALHAEALLRQRYAEEANALRQSRERTLHQTADLLHDRVQPELSGVRYVLTSLQRRGQWDEQAQNDLAWATQTLQQLSEQVRSILEAAKPMDWSQLTLAEALAWVVERWHHSGQAVDIVLDTSRYDEADAPAAKDVCYAVARLALSNVLAHAQAQHASLQLAASTTQTQLTVRDDGVGFDPASTASLGAERRHLGLANMRLRAQEVGGELVIHSQPGRGTTVSFTLPRFS